MHARVGLALAVALVAMPALAAEDRADNAASAQMNVGNPHGKGLSQAEEAQLDAQAAAKQQQAITEWSEIMGKSPDSAQDFGKGHDGQ
jgi:hypothetical protein